MKYLSIMFVLALIFACKKKDLNFVIEGNVTNNTAVQGLSNATVSIYQKLIGSASETLVQSTTTDASGYYVLEFPREQVEYYKITIVKQNFFDVVETLPFSSLSTENNNQRDFSTTAKSWVRLVFQNINDQQPGDFIQYTKQEGKQGCAECCPITQQTIQDMNYVEIICINDGNTDYSYIYNTNGDFGPTVGSESINTIPFDTVTIVKSY